MDAEFQAGTQEYYHVPCPHCGSHQRLEFANLKFNETWPYDPRIECQHCHEEIREHHKRAMVAKGEFVATHPDRATRHRSFHVDALISNLTTWDKLVEAWTEAQGSLEAKKTFYNLWLGLPFPIQGDAPDAELLHARAVSSPYSSGQIPDGVLFLTGFCDVQKNRLEVSVYGWGVLETRWLIEHQVIEGDTAELSCWIGLEKYRQKVWTDSQGKTLKLSMLGVDSGYQTQMVYRFVAGKPDVMATKGGSDGHNAPLISSPRQAIARAAKGSSHAGSPGIRSAPGLPGGHGMPL
jgi:Bacteriophage tail assembly protein